MLNVSVYVYVHVYVSVVCTHYCSQIYIYLATVVCVITSQLSVLVIF